MAATALFFDLDGTIWDSWPWYSLIFHSALGVAPDIIIGALQAGQSIVRLVREYGLTKSRLVDLSRDLLPQLDLYPEVMETLGNLMECQIPTGVVTNLPAWLAEPWLEGMLLNQLLPIKQFSARKPSPHRLIQAVQRFPKQPSPQVFYVGDSGVDEQAARRAGVSFAWAAYGYGRVPLGNRSPVLEKFSDVLRL